MESSRVNVFHKYNCVPQCCTRHCAQWLKILSIHIILPKANIPYLQIRSRCISNKHVIHHVRDHHSCLAKKVFSQNPPSNFNLHYFSSRMFLTGRYPHHHSKGRKQRGKNKLRHILCETQYKFHSFLLHISVKCRTPNILCNHSIATSINVFLNEDILLKLLSHFWNGLLNGIKHYTDYN